MIPVNTLIDKINSLIASGTLTEEQSVDLSKAVNTIEKKGISVVDSISELSAANNTGRIIFDNSVSRYYISNGVEWVTGLDFVVIDLKQNLYAWGANTNGRLGDGTTTSRLSPVSVVGGFTDWISASAGNAHSLGVRLNGTLWAWGSNNYGQLGDNTTTRRSSPVSVVGGFTDWIDVSAGGSHSLGVRANGTAWAWGNNLSGELGDGTTVAKSSPVSVVGGFADWISASAGGQHSLGIRANGTLWAWGLSSFGRLGDGTTIVKSSPVSVVGGFTDWIDVSAGYRHSLGVRANGTVWAWGFNGQGQLGDGTITSQLSPVSVVGGFVDWVDVSAGRQHSLGLRANGTVWAWGDNLSGQLGDGTITSRLSPVSVVGGFTDWVSASAGAGHSLGLRANGTAWAWGLNTYGLLGDNTTTTRSSPVSVVGGFTDWIDASAGNAHSLGVRA